MATVAILVPSRGRPERFAGLVQALNDTCTTDYEIWLGIDQDDPTRDKYGFNLGVVRGAHKVYPNIATERTSLVDWTNNMARLALDTTNALRVKPMFLVSLGDDHRPRTIGWDRMLIEAIRSLPDAQGWAYGNDLIQGEALPTAWMVTADVAEALGWVMLPGLQHMYPDNAVLELGRLTGRLRYRPDVVIEHMHPIAGRAKPDETYEATNNAAVFNADLATFEQWRDGGGLAEDAKRLEVALR